MQVNNERPTFGGGGVCMERNVQLKVGHINCNCNSPRVETAYPVFCSFEGLRGVRRGLPWCGQTIPALLCFCLAGLLLTSCQRMWGGEETCARTHTRDRPSFRVYIERGSRGSSGQKGVAEPIRPFLVIICRHRLRRGCELFSWPSGHIPGHISDSVLSDPNAAAHLWDS